MFTLTIETGKHKGRRLRLSPGELVIGRDEGSGIRVASGEVSRRHCVFVTNESAVVLRDLESRNGTFVNGVAISGDRQLKADDVIVVGPLGFRFHTPTASAKGASKGTNPKRSGMSESALSDDDIASWLSDEEEPSTGDTTIVTGRSAPAAVPPPIPVPDSIPVSPATPLPPKREFKSVAAEAADIIRRHIESLKEQ